MPTFIALYICLSGQFCPTLPVPSTHYWHSLEDCEREAKDIARAMSAVGSERYGFKCERVDYDPPNLNKSPKAR